jgi:hypothetical protein
MRRASPNGGGLPRTVIYLPNLHPHYTSWLPRQQEQATSGNGKDIQKLPDASKIDEAGQANQDQPDSQKHYSEIPR